MLTLLTATVGLIRAQAADVTGEWAVTLNTSAPSVWTAVLKQNGTAVSGQMRLGELRTAEAFDLTGTVQDKKITLNFIVTTPDRIQETMKMIGEIDGDSIKGEKANFWEAGEGPWAAKRKETK